MTLRARASGWLLAGAALAAASCSAGGEQGVGVAEVSTSLAFGAAPDTPVAALANFTPAPVDSVRASAPLELPDAALPPPPGGNSGRRTRAPLTTACPAATVDEFPDLGATTWDPDDDKPLPRPGLYRWQRSGKLRLAGTEVETDVAGFERRLLRNVAVELEEFDDDGRRVRTVFTYETVQPESAGDHLVVTSFRVRSDAEAVRVESPVDEREVSAGEPDRGLSIASIDLVDRHGNVVDRFAPVRGLLLLPLEVVVGEHFQSVAIDSRSGRQMAIEGQVVRRAQVDACGDLVEGWLVESTVTSSGGGADFVREYDYVVAPQYGAVIVAERIEEEGAGSLHLDFHLGQQDPDPVAGSGA